MKHLKKLNYLTLDLKEPDPSSLKVYDSLKEYSWLTIISLDAKVVNQAWGNSLIDGLILAGLSWIIFDFVKCIWATN